MRRFLSLCVAVLLVAGLDAGGVVAAPLDPALQTQLIAIYQRYSKAIAAGKVNEALATRAAAARKRLDTALKNRKQRAGLLEFAKFMTFDAVEVVHGTLDKSGTQARIMTIATKKIPADFKGPPGSPAPGSTARIELTLEFLKEKSGWKFDEQTFGGDPDKIAPCPDESFEPIDAYDLDKDVDMGGPIRRVEFQDEYTLIVVRVLDTENCAYLPARARLEVMGFNPAHLVPYAIVTMAGRPHRNDPQKVWVEKLEVTDD